MCTFTCVTVWMKHNSILICLRFYVGVTLYWFLYDGSCKKDYIVLVMLLFYGLGKTRFTFNQLNYSILKFPFSLTAGYLDDDCNT